MPRHRRKPAAVLRTQHLGGRLDDGRLVAGAIEFANPASELIEEQSDAAWIPLCRGVQETGSECGEEGYRNSHDDFARLVAR